METGPQTKFIDWKDVAIHAACGAGVGIIAALLPWTFVQIFLLVANGLFWFGREAQQRIARGEYLVRLFYSHQVLLEWLSPILACVMFFALVRAVLTAIL